MYTVCTVNLPTAALITLKNILRIHWALTLSRSTLNCKIQTHCTPEHIHDICSRWTQGYAIEYAQNKLELYLLIDLSNTNVIFNLYNFTNTIDCGALDLASLNLLQHCTYSLYTSY